MFISVEMRFQTPYLATMQAMGKSYPSFHER
jgi:hypothetical protein